jgi:hypothetical protein
MSNRKGEHVLYDRITITNVPKRSLSNIILMLTSQWIVPALFICPVPGCLAPNSAKDYKNGTQFHCDFLFFLHFVAVIVSDV